MGDPGAPVTTLLPSSHPGPCRSQARLLLGHKAQQPAHYLALGTAGVGGALSGGFSCYGQSGCSPGKSPRTGRLDLMAAQSLVWAL